MYAFGRLLQLLGLIVLPLAMFLQFQEQLTLGQMLAMACFGGLLFYIGYILQGLGQKDAN